ncbi:MAG: hypothetical protein R3F38_09065 [Gammaproteobacteria bacterium]
MHTIQSVAERTGLTPDVIRIWERRYQAVSRTVPPPTSACTVKTTSSGWICSSGSPTVVAVSAAVANLSNTELRDMLAQQPPSPVPAAAACTNTNGSNGANLTSDAIDTILQLDPIRFEAVLNRAMLDLGSWVS